MAINLNRREFFAGGGAVLATGCVPSRAAGAMNAAEWSLDGKLRLHMKCPMLAEPVKVWIAGDTHLGLHDGRDDNHAANYRRMAQ